MVELRPPFDLFEPPAEDIYAEADVIERYAGDVESLDSAVGRAHSPAVVNVAGLLEHPMIAAIDNAKAAATHVMQGCVVAGAACRRWGMHVAYYNHRVENLNNRWEAEVANDFGAERIDVPTGAAPEDVAAATEAFNAEKAALRAAVERELAALKQQYDAELDAAADEVAGLLAPGEVSEATLIDLYNGGALSAAMAPAFAHADYVAQGHPVARWWNLVASGVIPRELWEMPADDIRDYLLLNPDRAEDVVPAFGLLLGLQPLLPQEEVFLEALGAYDAYRVATAVAGWPPGRDSLSRIEEGTTRLRDINARLTFGGTLTEGDKRYMHAWYDGVGADNLAALPGHVDHTLAGDPMLDTPHGQALSQMAVAAGHDYMQLLRGHYLGPVADGIMNLSNPELGGTDSVDAMPEAVQELVHTEIGYLGPGGMRSQYEGWTERRDLYNPDPEAFTVAGLGRYAGFAALMEASTVRGGTEFTADLGRSAIRVQQNLHAIAASADRALMEDQERALLLNATTSDAPSTMLSVVGRNPDASAELLLDAQYLQPLLGIPWSDDTGAAAVILAGTVPDVDGAGRTEQHAEAALAVFLEVASDHDGYQERMSEGVSDAVVDVAINWIDTFARTPGLRDAEGVDVHGWVEEQLPLAGYSDRVPGIALTRDAQQLFLEFVAATGTARPEDGGSRFGVAVELNSIKWIADALRTGDEGSVNNAVRSAATLDGSFVRANYEHVMDEDRTQQEAARDAAVQKQRQIALASNLVLGGSTSGIWAMLLGGSASQATKNVGSALISIALSGGFRAIDQISGLGELPPLISGLDTASGRLFQENTHAAPGARNYTLTMAALAAGNDPLAGVTDPEMRQELASLFEAGADGGAVRRDDSGMPRLRPYDDLRYEEGRGGTNRDNLRTAVDRVYHDNVDVVYDEVWDTYNSTTYFDSPSPNSLDDAKARQLLYGDQNVRSGGTDDYYRRWAPTEDPYEQLTR